MTVVVDSSFVLALANSADEHHAGAAAWLASEDEELVTSPLVIAEIDAALAAHADPAAAQAFWGDLDAGAYTVRWWADALSETLGVARRGEDVMVSLVEASLVAVAARVGTDRIATFRTDHVGRLTTVDGTFFTLLP